MVVNAGEVALSGKKWDRKLYRHHTMYPGGLKEIAAKDLLDKKPTDVCRCIDLTLPCMCARVLVMRVSVCTRFSCRLTFA